ncbi:MAG: hypothetical protein JOY87_00510, partial [Candidatus Eremiobacteraeota bacterium]|nr:hypothetical protein [Candidatus Eremiobacteraeota bacterium]
MKLKRWLLVALLGAFLILDGFGRVLKAYDFNFHINERINQALGPHFPTA